MKHRIPPGMVLPPGMVPGLLDQNQQDYPTQVSKSLGLQARAPGHLDPTIQLGITVDDLREAEFQYLRRRTRWTASLTQAAVAAQRASMQLAVSPVNPSVITVIERIIVSNFNAAVSSFKWGWKQIEAGVPGSVATRDMRTGGTAVPAASFGRMTSAGPATIRAGGVMVLPASGTAVIELGWVILTPGNVGAGECFGIVNESVLQELDVTIEWTERVALPSEF
jgi:hypothetical protein